MSERVPELSRSSSEYIEEIDFQKYWLVLKRRWLPAGITFGTVVGLAVLAATTEDSVYEAEGRVQFRNDRAPALTGLEDDLGQVEVLNFQAEPLETQSEIVRSRSIMETVITRLDLRTADGEPLSPSLLVNAVDVDPVPGTEILSISFASDDPEEAAAIVNEVIAAYQAQNIASNRQEAASALEFIGNQLPTTEDNLRRAEEELQAFKEENDVISLEDEASSSVEVLSAFDRDMTQLQSQLAEVNAQVGEIQQRLSISSDDAIALSSVNQSEGVQSALEELQTAQAELASQQSRYRDGHPAIDELELRESQLESLLQNRIATVLERQNRSASSISPGDLQLGELRQTLIAELANLEVMRTGLADRMTQLAQSRASYIGRASNLPRLERQQRELERTLEAYRLTHETLLTQQQETRVIENQTVGNVRVVSLAEVPNSPMGSNSRLFVVAGGFAGILLAITVAFLLDLLDNSVKTVKEARELLGYTLLGIIPKVEDSPSRMTDPSYPRLLVHQTDQFRAREAYQMLQANLKFLQSDEELKTYVVTSSAIGEGKSEVCANLAAVLAQVGKRVLVVDADMRYPRQHHAMDVMNSLGLSHVIAGQARVDSAIRPVMKNLDILTAGVVPPNPIALLDSKRMEALLQSFARQYDAVIVDAPPLVGYADASILSKMADGLIFVVRPGSVTYEQGRAAKEIIERSNQRVLGMVVNGVSTKSEPGSRFSEMAVRTPAPVSLPAG
ncbi:GumC family protein [Vacuolonema iberomarrocanum]|uniref:GumC family protein n=1 Tax=Vacuolonema iberomarrocanum TaxID=3454632 RepID=UPI0019DFE401|nr:polysaccharide biosynthesis tyrosine autokinase [filamentous cyanobacterium LEGE 07170]